MILFLVLAFSQPIQTNKLSSNSSKKLICIYIDNSFSMGNSSRNGELLSQAKFFADQIIKSYGENDRFQIISNHYLPQDQYLQYKENAQNLVANIEIDFKSLTVDEIKLLVVEDKWMATIEHSVKNEMQRISQRLTARVKELADRYELALPSVLNEVKSLQEKVNTHLSKMGYIWN